MKIKRDYCVSAVVVAGGQGTRMNMDKNKQYVEIAGKMVLARTLEAFQDSVYIDEIILVVNSDDIIYCKDEIVKFYDLSKVKTLVSGGKERQQSVYNGLKEVSANSDIILIHDGARPFIDEEIIERCVLGVLESGAVSVGVPVKDTIKTTDIDGNIAFTLDRSSLWSIQTPQGFKAQLILDAHKRAIDEGFVGTDDAVLVERLGQKVKVVMGDYLNIKITTKEDLVIGEAFARKYF